MTQAEQKSRPPSILRQDSEMRGGMQEYASPSPFHQSPAGKQTPKSVSIANQPEVISPLMLGERKNVDSEFYLDQAPSPRRPSVVKGLASKRLSGRPAISPNPSLKLSSFNSFDFGGEEDSDRAHNHRSSNHNLEHLIDQVSEWIKSERTKRARKQSTQDSTDGTAERKGGSSENDHPDSSGKRRGSDASETTFELDKLEDIIKYNLSLERRSRYSRTRGSISQSRRTSLAKSRKQSYVSSDTDYLDGDIFVPTCDAVLDNSKTLSYTGGASSDSESSSDELERTASYKDLDAWAKFKFEIVRLIHTLRLKGWSRVPLYNSNAIHVQRLSGALTNAVYVVKPPSDLPPRAEREGSTGQVQPRKPPPDLLLRIYGSQVDHLIDRDSELAILRRLCKKNIGPRLLGTFTNGRFEEFFHAKTLTPEDLRNSDTSRQIAKRMRELHDGIDLLDHERNAGAFVWQNWDKWVKRVEQVVSWLDNQIMHLKPNAKPTGPEAWKRRGFICGVPWKQFREVVEKYRDWLDAQYGGREKVREQMVFAHNDTQYGNIMRILPTGESPLLLPANTHKQLVVIDFEYSNANLPAYEFANHFSEWCYNYHDPKKPYAFHASRYPTPEEQDRFIRAYVRHRPDFNVPTPKMTPSTPTFSPSTPAEHPSRRPTSSISDFMLDARAPSVSSLSNLQNEEAARKAAEDREVERLIHETRLWRLACAAQWVAWGIVQATVPGMPDFGAEENGEPGSTSGEDDASEEFGERADVYEDLSRQKTECAITHAENEEAEDEFDNLGYAQHRAMFFWGDAIQFGFAKEEDLPEELRSKIKTVRY